MAVLGSLSACVRDLPDSVVRPLAAPAPRARGGGRPEADRTRRGGGGTPLGGNGTGAGQGGGVQPAGGEGQRAIGPCRGRRASLAA